MHAFEYMCVYESMVVERAGTMPADSMHRALLYTGMCYSKAGTMSGIQHAQVPIVH